METMYGWSSRARFNTVCPASPLTALSILVAPYRPGLRSCYDRPLRPRPATLRGLIIDGDGKMPDQHRRFLVFSSLKENCMRQRFFTFSESAEVSHSSQCDQLTFVRHFHCGSSHDAIASCC